MNPARLGSDSPDHATQELATTQRESGLCRESPHEGECETRWSSRQGLGLLRRQGSGKMCLDWWGTNYDTRMRSVREAVVEIDIIKEHMNDESVVEQMMPKCQRQ